MGASKCHEEKGRLLEVNRYLRMAVVDGFGLGVLTNDYFDGHHVRSFTLFSQQRIETNVHRPLSLSPTYVRYTGICITMCVGEGLHHIVVHGCNLQMVICWELGFSLSTLAQQTK